MHSACKIAMLSLNNISGVLTYVTSSRALSRSVDFPNGKLFGRRFSNPEETEIFAKTSNKRKVTIA